MSYKRLTKRYKDGTAGTIKQPKSEYVATVYDEQLRINNEVLNRLSELEDKIENGTLIELPCKVGDKVYYVNECRPTPNIEEYVVYGILLDESRIILHIDGWETIMAKNVYYTKAEAENKLKELQNDL